MTSADFWSLQSATATEMKLQMLDRFLKRDPTDHSAALKRELIKGDPLIQALHRKLQDNESRQKHVRHQERGVIWAARHGSAWEANQAAEAAAEATKSSHGRRASAQESLASQGLTVRLTPNTQVRPKSPRAPTPVERSMMTMRERSRAPTPDRTSGTKRRVPTPPPVLQRASLDHSEGAASSHTQRRVDSPPGLTFNDPGRGWSTLDQRDWRTTTSTMTWKTAPWYAYPADGKGLDPWRNYKPTGSWMKGNWEEPGAAESVHMTPSKGHQGKWAGRSADQQSTSPYRRHHWQDKSTQWVDYSEVNADVKTKVEEATTDVKSQENDTASSSTDVNMAVPATDTESFVTGVSEDPEATTDHTAALPYDETAGDWPEAEDDQSDTPMTDAEVIIDKPRRIDLRAAVKKSKFRESFIESEVFAG